MADKIVCGSLLITNLSEALKQPKFYVEHCPIFIPIEQKIHHIFWLAITINQHVGVKAPHIEGVGVRFR